MRLTFSRICAPMLLALAFFNSVGAAYAAPATPSQISPWNGSNVGGTAIAFSWSSSTGATNYYFQLARDSGFTNVAFAGWIGNYVGVTISGLPDNGQAFY